MEQGTPQIESVFKSFLVQSVHSKCKGSLNYAVEHMEFRPQTIWREKYNTQKWRITADFPIQQP